MLLLALLGLSTAGPARADVVDDATQAIFEYTQDPEAARRSVNRPAT